MLPLRRRPFCLFPTSVIFASEKAFLTITANSCIKPSMLTDGCMVASGGPWLNKKLLCFLYSLSSEGLKNQICHCLLAGFVQVKWGFCTCHGELLYIASLQGQSNKQREPLLSIYAANLACGWHLTGCTKFKMGTQVSLSLELYGPACTAGCSEGELGLLRRWWCLFTLPQETQLSQCAIKYKVTGRKYLGLNTRRQEHRELSSYAKAILLTRQA